MAGSVTTVVPPETTTPSLFQETVVAGPPVEVQVRVNTGVAASTSEVNWNWIVPCILGPPGKRHIYISLHTLDVLALYKEAAVIYLEQRIARYRVASGLVESLIRWSELIFVVLNVHGACDTSRMT